MAGSLVETGAGRVQPCVGNVLSDSDSPVIRAGSLIQPASNAHRSATGAMLTPALRAGETLDATVANMRFVKPLDTRLVIELAASHDLLVSIEENSLIGGAGAEVARALESSGLNTPLLRLGLPDRFIDHGDSALLLAEAGLDETGILRSVASRLATQDNS